MKRMILFPALFLAACSPQGYEVLESVADQTVQDIACKNQNFETKLWDGLKTYLLEQDSDLNSDDLKKAFRHQIIRLQADNPQWPQAEAQQLTAELAKLITLLLEEAPAGERIQTPQELLLLLSAIDVGDRSTTFRSYIQDKVRGQLNGIQKLSRTFELNCQTPNETEGETEDPVATEEPNRDFEYHKAQALKEGLSLASFGGRWAVATAYQSCQATQLPALNRQSPDVSGISIVGTHPDGVGSKRMISSLSKLQSTHTYIKDMNLYGESCFNVRQNPLIYDYGGKPYATTSSSSAIDFFRNNGSGTSVLGFDCSAFVFSAMATAGLKLKENRDLKASDSWAWGSGSYVEPQKNGLTCLNKISVSPQEDLKTGDIVAVYGHVLMIDRVGEDPFGIARAQSSADCSKLSAAGFDFVVAQSSNSKNGIGVNYFAARDYLQTSEKMRAGLEKYAYYACLAKLNQTSYTPNLGTLSIVRHKNTASCKAPRVQLARESCISSCSRL